MPRTFPLILLWIAISIGAVAAQEPEADPRALLVAMGERVAALQGYEANITRLTEVTTQGEYATTEAVFHMAWERPNRALLLSDRPEGRLEVICDGQHLRVTAVGSTAEVVLDAPEDLPGILEASDGLIAEGLAIGGLFFAENPVDELIAGFDNIHILGGSTLNGRHCRLVGLESRDGLRMVLWLDAETLLPCQATLDATATLRAILTAQGINDQGARMVVTETHSDVSVNPSDMDFSSRP